jgi:hypothetical protein
MVPSRRQGIGRQVVTRLIAEAASVGRAVTVGVEINPTLRLYENERKVERASAKTAHTAGANALTKPIFRSNPSSGRSKVQVADLTSVVEAPKNGSPALTLRAVLRQISLQFRCLCAHKAHTDDKASAQLLHWRCSTLAGSRSRPKKFPQTKLQTKSRFYAGVTVVRSGNSSAIKALRGALGEIRTPDPQIRSLVLYPAELRAPAAHHSGFDANVTCVRNDDRAISRVVCFGRTPYGSRNMSS